MGKLEYKMECRARAVKLNNGKKLSRTANYMLMNAFDMVDREGGILFSRQAIASILVSADMIDGLEKRKKSH